MKLPEAIHFIGIGGAGMAPMAELLLARGVKISGSDLALNEKCRHLEEGGAVIKAGHSSENVPDDAGMIVFSSAVTEDNPERIRGRELNIPEMRRGEFLAFFLTLYRRVAAVSGSHGKSSITAMLVHILLECGFHPGYMIGAAVPGGKSSDGGEEDDIFVTEADESDATHKLLSPHLGIVPNVDGDHAWSVGGDEALKENFRAGELAMKNNDVTLLGGIGKRGKQKCLVAIQRILHGGAFNAAKSQKEGENDQNRKDGKREHFQKLKRGSGERGLFFCFFGFFGRRFLGKRLICVAIILIGSKGRTHV